MLKQIVHSFFKATLFALALGVIVYLSAMVPIG